MKPIVQYDSSKEDLIERYICEFDKNPIICNNPVEGTSYLGILFNKNNLHRYFFKKHIQEYKDYVQEFVKSNQSSPDALEYVERILTWLWNKFKNYHKQFANSPLREEWRRSGDMPEWLETNMGDGLFEGKLNTKREAYNFFFRVSGSQKYYLKELIDFITDQLLPIIVTNNAMIPAKRFVGKIESKTVYTFALTKTATSKAGVILSLLHANLKKHGYINCSAYEFKRLFVDYTRSKPLKSPSPIIWQSEYYNHLAYFINCLIKNKIITPTKVPSNYKIALHLFNDRNENNFYHPSKERYDGNLNPKDQAKIDSIIEKSLKD